MKLEAAEELITRLRGRLNALSDLALTFVRAHLETADGTIATAGARTEKTAAKRARS